jgi:hypothetical protein
MMTTEKDDTDSDGHDPSNEEIITGNSRVSFHYYTKGTLGKKNQTCYLELESRTIIFPGEEIKPIGCILNTLKIPNTPGGLVLSISRTNTKLQEKKWFFPSEKESSSFQLYLATLSTSGENFYKIFQIFDRRQIRQFTSKDLRQIGLKYGFNIPSEDCQSMIHLLDENKNDYLDYIEFFKYFMNIPVMITGMESCLLEWQNQYLESLTRNSSTLLGSNSPGGGSGIGCDYGNKGYQTANTTLTTNSFLLDSPPTLISGEKMLTVIQHVRYTLTPITLRTPKFSCVGHLYLTNYRLIFSSFRHRTNLLSMIPKPFDEMTIPLACIQKTEILTKAKDSLYTLAIFCKDFRIIRIAFDAQENFTSTFEDVLASKAFPTNLKNLFAFFYSENFQLITNMTTSNLLSQSSSLMNHGWDLYSPRREFCRQEVLQNDYFRICCDNFTLIDTYPKEFIIPQGIPMEQIIEAAKFRSRNRLPVLTFRNQRNGAVLTRSSQPMVGILAHRSLADKLLLNLYRVRGNIHDPSEIENPSDFYIMDCRKAIAATVNSAMGKGVEDEKHYDRTKVVFLEIENIHVMRASFQLLEHVISQGLYLSASAAPYDDTKFASKIEETEWLVHARRILKASVMVAEKLELERASVLVHCR